MKIKISAVSCYGDDELKGYHKALEFFKITKSDDEHWDYEIELETMEDLMKLSKAVGWPILIKSWSDEEMEKLDPDIRHCYPDYLSIVDDYID